MRKTFSTFAFLLNAFDRPFDPKDINVEIYIRLKYTAGIP